MGTNTQTNNKRIYCSPVIECVKLDNEISLALESDPPTYESKCNLNQFEFLNNDPFKTDLG